MCRARFFVNSQIIDDQAFDYWCMQQPGGEQSLLCG
jgi:hypothetical protein